MLKKKKKNKNKDSTTLPPQEKKGLLQHPRRRSRLGAVNCCRKDLHPRCLSYPRFSSFLCKCNLTKS